MFCELLSMFLLPPALLGLLISVGFEFVLEKGLKKYLLQLNQFPRMDLLSSNREGIVQLPGLVALYLIGMQIGRLLMRWR